jgi:site-specific DNA-methyltransferase (adenine-specific)
MNLSEVHTGKQDCNAIPLPGSEHPARMLDIDEIIHGDCRKLLKKLPSNSIDLVVTSPPYADNRQTPHYEGVPIDEYIDWYMPISKELLRVLKPTGSFILNIKERVVNGERHTYVLELILAMRRQGWLWTEEYIWCKRNCYPGKWPNRFRDSWERCLHFTKSKEFKMRQDKVMVPVGDWAKKRLKNLNGTDKTRDPAKTESGFGKKVENWVGREKVYPTNVLHLATECSNRNHSATFPISLPTWFINLLTDKGDVVLDPFMGSGTSAIACIDLDRHYIGFEISGRYYREAIDAVERRKAGLPIARRADEENGKRR